MKIFISIFISTFAWLSLNLSYAGTGTNQSYQFFVPAPLSKARIQLATSFGNQLIAPDFKSSFALNSSSSEDRPTAHKDRRKAFFRSLILPGAGEYYLGKRTLAKSFFFTEITLWISYFAFRQYGNWMRDDALTFAATHSGADVDDKPSQFFIDMGNYPDVYQYNDAKQRSFQFEKVYSDADYFWSWDLDKNRLRFDHMRVAGDRAKNRSVFILGGIFTNHLLSAIHSVWQTHRYNKKIDKMSDSRIQLQFNTNYLTGEFSFKIQKEF
jgi:hypothetical protein